MTTGKITGINANLITVQVDGPILQNEICYVLHKDMKLMAEVIKVFGQTAYAQVFESTTGLRNGSEVHFSGRLLEIALGPGLMSKNFDGLQNDLNKMAGTFLRFGESAPPLDSDVFYNFRPLLNPGDHVKAGTWIGVVRENWIEHKIMVPFSFDGTGQIVEILPMGDYRINDQVAIVSDERNETIPITMVQKWPIKRAMECYQSKHRPNDILETGLRVIDTFNPLLEGGTGFIPGPFGTGKTVLQQSIARNGEADIIVLVACGERANEVVEIFTEFPELIDPRSGRRLAERTCIICNTSNMPVAAREASVYVGMTIAEYYRNMGLKVLLLADSTSRWAQALREMSNRLEELPGPDAFPVELPAIVANFYGRAGTVKLHNDAQGSITFLGTVSPAGGNFKEPVTESTSKVARCFYALSQKRADSKRYPAIDPLDSYSKYLGYPEFEHFSDANIQQGWVSLVAKAKDILRKGIEARDQINILGDDAVPIDYHIDYWKSEVIDFVLLQQDSFDEIDKHSPMQRQKYMMNKVMDLCDKDFAFDDFEMAGTYFKKVINMMKQMNYAQFLSSEFEKYEKELQELVMQAFKANLENATQP